MNILQLCKAAERFEMLCMMNFSDSDISRAAEMAKVPFGVLRELITVADETTDRGSRFASMVHRDEELVMQVFLHDNFYEIWETIVNS